MPIPWNDDPPGSLLTIAANISALGRDLLAQARKELFSITNVSCTVTPSP